MELLCVCSEDRRAIEVTLLTPESTEDFTPRSLLMLLTSPKASVAFRIALLAADEIRWGNIPNRTEAGVNPASGLSHNIKSETR